MNETLADVIRNDYVEIFNNLKEAIINFKQVNLIFGRHATPAGKAMTISMATVADEMETTINKTIHECKYSILWHRDDDYNSISQTAHGLIDQFTKLVIMSGSIPMNNNEQLTPDELLEIKSKQQEMLSLLLK